MARAPPWWRRTPKNTVVTMAEPMAVASCWTALSEPLALPASSAVDVADGDLVDGAEAGAHAHAEHSIDGAVSQGVTDRPVRATVSHRPRAPTSVTARPITTIRPAQLARAAGGRRTRR